MGQTHAFRWFKKHLFRSYIENFDMGSLLRGLDYLMQQELEPALLKRDNTHIIHGKKDRIAPLSEILEFLGAPPFPPVSIIEKTGHLPFLEPGFKEGIKRL
jgi:pimeloyl-ACP methyl ester carboxylesterase